MLRLTHGSEISILENLSSCTMTITKFGLVKIAIQYCYSYCTLQIVCHSKSEMGVVSVLIATLINPIITLWSGCADCSCGLLVIQLNQQNFRRLI